MDESHPPEIPLPEMGALSALLAQPQVEDIYVLGPRRVVVRLADGTIRLTDVDFGSQLAAMRVVSRLLAHTGKEISAERPFVDARLPDGSRVHIAIDPCADPSPQIVIRRHRLLFAAGQDRLEQLIALGTITPQAALLLRYAMRAGASMLVAGATGAGKSTFISALSSEIDPLCPVVCIEDTRELDFPGINVSWLLTHPTRTTGPRGISQRTLVHQALRKSPRWIVLGEARGAEAWDFTQAGNTGHGILASVHANSARDALERYRDMCMEAGENMNEAMVLRSVLRAFRLVVFIELEQSKRRTRRVVRHIADVTSNVAEGNIPVLQDLFLSDGHRLECTKFRPYPRLAMLLEDAGCDYMNIVQGHGIPQAWTAAEQASLRNTRQP